MNVLVRMLGVVAKSSPLSSFTNNFEVLQPFGSTDLTNFVFSGALPGIFYI